jgi:hypothetical protein
MAEISYRRHRFPPAIIQHTVKGIVGTWTLVSAEAFGPNPKGIAIFDANGHMWAQLMRRRPSQICI